MKPSHSHSEIWPCPSHHRHQPLELTQATGAYVLISAEAQFCPAFAVYERSCPLCQKLGAYPNLPSIERVCGCSTVGTHHRRLTSSTRYQAPLLFLLCRCPLAEAEVSHSCCRISHPCSNARITCEKDTQLIFKRPHRFPQGRQV